MDNIPDTPNISGLVRLIDVVEVNDPELEKVRKKLSRNTYIAKTNKDAEEQSRRHPHVTIISCQGIV